jgi:tetratricopeptide (TPR) repeat protein
LAAFNKQGRPDRALQELAAAFTLDPSDARLLLELDQLRKRLGFPPDERLSLLGKHMELVDRRDDLFLEHLSLLNLRGDNDRALELLLGRKFHPWEGGEGKVSRQYHAALLGLSKCSHMKGEYSSAASFAERALSYPENLGEGKLFGAMENDVFYYLGCALAGRGSDEKAKAAFEQAARGERELSLSMSYNDQPADMLFFQGLACARLGKDGDTRECFSRLVDYAERHGHDTVSTDYFAVSMPDFLIFEDDLTRRNSIFCKYLLGLGLLGLEAGEEKARALFEKVLVDEPSHSGAREILRDLERGWKF